jgi:hypothetical protein
MTECSIEEHEQKCLMAFAEVRRAENALAEAETAQTEAKNRWAMVVGEAETRLTTAWQALDALMKETGELELLLPSEDGGYKVAYDKPRETVKVENVDAVPDEFVKTERKPKLKDIGDHLKDLRAAKVALPNWATLQKGEPKLVWRHVKKGVA